MGPRAAGLWRNAHVRRVEKRRVGHDEIGRAVGQPCRSARAGGGRVGDDSAGALGEPVFGSVFGRQGGKFGVDLDEIDPRSRHSFEQGQPDGANAGADINDMFGFRRGRGKQSGVAADAMTLGGLT